jgi:hypothetical protein
MNAPRGGYTRGTTPRSPGDLTARTAEQQRREAAAVERRKAQTTDGAEIRKAAYLSGYDAGWVDGADFVLDKLRQAGLDVDSILALDADEENAE